MLPITYGFLSTFPPTQCGLATFTASMMRSLTTSESRDRAGVVRVVDSGAGAPVAGVVEHLDQRPDAVRRAAAALNTFDVAVVQHEYGIYGGPDGDQLLAVLDAVVVPVIVVAHTVLATPSPHQREVLERVVAAADAVVTMTVAARDRLVRGYAVDSTKISVIPHGARPGPVTDVSTVDKRPLILTWGLIGPGKGIEWAIDGLRGLRGLTPRPRYLVAGQTHPRVLEQQGERYRRELRQRAQIAGVSDLVELPGKYLDDTALAALVRQASVVMLPYDSHEQVTSGVLVEAVAAGKPVVATRFPHAVELLGSGAGLLVPHFDGPAMGDALHRVLTEPGLARGMAEEAGRLAPAQSWTNVAAQYRRLASRLLAGRARPRRVLADALKG